MVMRKKILLVEDNAELLELMRLGFEQAGFFISTARDGIEALRKAKSLDPHLIVLDLMLPELDGFAVCETIRQDRGLSSIPILVLSGLRSELSRLAGFESGATDFLTKPAGLADILKKVESILAVGNGRATHKDLQTSFLVKSALAVKTKTDAALPA
jgi:DNA-binding response OmpR family regulator